MKIQGAWSDEGRKKKEFKIKVEVEEDKDKSQKKISNIEHRIMNDEVKKKY